MTTPDWIKPGLYGVAIGAIAATIAGFSLGGWWTGGGAEAMAEARSRAQVVAALTPVCLAASESDPDRTAKMALIVEAAASGRRNVVMETGWATPPGAQDADRDLAQACLDGLAIPAA